ncbi:MAG: hypothetical protein AAGF45_08320 [Pseudomonadota bacterium]
MADDPCKGIWDNLWNGDVCKVLTNANSLGGELEDAAEKVRWLAEASDDVVAQSKFKKVADRLDAAGAHLKKGGKIVDTIASFDSFSKFHKSYVAITPKLIEDDPKAAAEHFGAMTVAAGKALQTMGPPLSGYGEFLAEAGDFFVHMEAALNPASRPAKAWRSYEKAMRGDFRGDKHLTR